MTTDSTYVNYRLRELEAFERRARGENSHQPKCSGIGSPMVYDPEYQKRWAASPVGKESRRRSSRKYDRSAKGRAFRKAWRESGKENRSQKKYRKGYRAVLHGTWKRALGRHLLKWPHDPSTLTFPQVISLWHAQSGLCALSGMAMTWGQGSIKSTSISIDRINNHRGYHIDNVRLICHSINALRGAGTDIEMLTMARAIVSWVDDDLPQFSPLRTAATAADVANLEN